MEWLCEVVFGVFLVGFFIACIAQAVEDRNWCRLHRQAMDWSLNGMMLLFGGCMGVLGAGLLAKCFLGVPS